MLVNQEANRRDTGRREDFMGSHRDIGLDRDAIDAFGASGLIGIKSNHSRNVEQRS
jgi:hypothetical protein